MRVMSPRTSMLLLYYPYVLLNVGCLQLYDTDGIFGGLGCWSKQVINLSPGGYTGFYDQ